MSNQDTQMARKYHEETKHTPHRLRMSTHVLDWANQPLPYKIYSSVPPVALPADFEPSMSSALDDIAGVDGDPTGKGSTLDLATLARLCFFTNGITKRRRRLGGEIAFRAAATTGALYHIELYLVCGDLADLPAGLYHYGAHDHALRRLRDGDFRQVLVDATGVEAAVAQAPVVAVYTSTFWRNAWKYQARSYRHSFWDNGTMLANLLAVAHAARLSGKVIIGYADEPVNRLLDVDPRHEAAVSLVALGRGAPPPPAPPFSPLNLPTVQLSARERRYEAIEEMHSASSLDSGQEAAAWRGLSTFPTLPSPIGPIIPIQPLDPSNLPRESIETVIRRRGSARSFAREPIGLGQLSTILDRSTQALSADSTTPTGGPLSDLYLIVHAVDGLRSGRYVYHCDRAELELLGVSHGRDESGWLALGQELAADAAVNIFFLVDLEPTLTRFGNRGYRAAQLTSAISAGRLYLAAYALGLGATGLTFFDDEVTTFFSPHANGKSVMFLLALGHPARRKQT